MNIGNELYEAEIFGRLLFWLIVLFVAFVITYVIIKKNKTNSKKDVNFIPENPQEKWECPECSEKNHNTDFVCKKCGYRIQ